MKEYLKPEDMDIVQKMKYVSTVSKVCKELDAHLGFSEKSVAEFLIAMAMGANSAKNFRQLLVENDITLDNLFTDSLYSTIMYLYPKNEMAATVVAQNGPVGMDTIESSVRIGLEEKQRSDEKNGNESLKEDLPERHSRSRSHSNSHHRHSRSRSHSNSHHQRSRSRSHHHSHRQHSRSRSHHHSHYKSNSHSHSRSRRFSRSRSPGAKQPLAVNQIYDGYITSIMDYGAFVELRNVTPRREGLVHVSNISRSRIGHPRDVLHRDQPVKVKIIQISGNRISLSMKDVDQETGEEITSTPVQPPSSRQPLPNVRRKRMSSWDRFEYNQLLSSGVLSPEEQKRLIDQYENVDLEEELKPEETVDVVVNEKQAPFLSNVEIRDEPERNEKVAIIKNPEGSMNRAALASSVMMQERKALRARQQREAQTSLPSGALTSFDDPMPEGGVHLLASEVRAMSDSRSSVQPSSLSHHPLPSVNRKTVSISEQRKSLPVYERREQLLQAIRDNTVLVVQGETGSGKTTQMTQYIVEAGLNGGKIVGCTQPRRVAAISVATRVAEEYGCRVGDEVGFSVRFNDRTSNRTIIKYMTDGMLMREYLLDGMLSKYSILILDEAHERTLYTDVLFALLKELIKKRRDLKLVITSATLDVMKFSQYYDNCPILNIKGRTFPVTTYYLSEPESNYIESSLQTVWDINKEEPPGDILVFLTGQEEIEYVCEALEERQKRVTDDSVPPMLICPVFGAQTNDQQQLIFQPTPPGYRKVVVATNIAEASLTIDGIYYVVDSGFCKQSVYNPKTGMDSLIIVPISQDSAKQRKGRAGRTGPGKCYRLYTKRQKKTEMLPHTIPEIQRSNLDNVVLMLKAMQINDILHFDFLDPPTQQAIVKAMERLYTLDCLDDDGLLTPLGSQMAAFPLSPQLSKALITSVELGCSGDTLTVVSMLSEENLFIRPKNKQAQADQKHAMLFASEGDQITYLTIYNNWQKNGKSKKWCDDRFLQERALRRAEDVRSQLQRMMTQFKMPILYSNHDYKAVQKSIVSGYFTNVAKRDSDGYKCLLDGTIVHLHPASSLKGREPEWVCYSMIRMTSREYMMNVMSIDPKWLVELAPKFYKTSDGKTITKNKKQEKLQPVFNYRLPDDSWRMSRRKGWFSYICSKQTWILFYKTHFHLRLALSTHLTGTTVIGKGTR